MFYYQRTGPATVPMVSQGGSPPVAMPVQVPPGHVMQQIVDEHRTLRHVILSTNHQMHAQSTVQDMPHLQGHYVSSFSFVFYVFLSGAMKYILCFYLSILVNLVLSQSEILPIRIQNLNNENEANFGIFVW